MTLDLASGQISNELGAAAFSAFKSVIGALKKGGGDAPEKSTNLIASATSKEPARANTF
jgi:hypothetical protein